MKLPFLRLSDVLMTLSMVTLTIVLVASLLGVSSRINADEFWRTDVATHEYSAMEVQTRAYLFYDNHTEESVELGYLYLYSKAVSGCVESASATVEADGVHWTKTLDVEPDVCATGNIDHTHHWGSWDGDVFEHEIGGSTIVKPRVYSGEQGTGEAMGWDLSFGSNLHQRDDCIWYCVSFDD